VAQVTAAGRLVSEETGVVATYDKLMRVALLLPVVLALAWLFRAPAPPGRLPALPGFLVMFAFLAVAGVTGLLPPAAGDIAGAGSRWCLLVAIAARGLNASLGHLTGLGWRPVLLVVLETLLLLALALVALVYSREGAGALSRS
jgi:uncharacterized membrane protein YadS